MPLVEPEARRRLQGYRGVNEAIIGVGDLGEIRGLSTGKETKSFSSFFQFFPLCYTLPTWWGNTGVNGDFLESPRNTLGGGLGPKEGLPQGPFLRETSRLGPLDGSPFYEETPGWVRLSNGYALSLWLGTPK